MRASWRHLALLVSSLAVACEASGGASIDTVDAGDSVDVVVDARASVDAGARDVGVDAGVRDAGARDAVVDAGPRDAGTPSMDVPSTDPWDGARDACVAEINRYRAMIGLAPYARWREAEDCADQMAENDARTGVAHDGFSRAICSPRGNGQNECPRYGGPDRLPACLAQMWAEGPSADGSWDVAHGHYLNMVGDYTYMGRRQRFTRVACGFSAAGWMVQNFQ